MNIVELLTSEFKLKKSQVESTIKLIDEGNTIPFIARYRKEQTGEMDDVTLRDLDERLTFLRNLEERQVEVIRLIEELDKLTPELKAKILSSKTITKIDDLYRPFRPKRRTRATIAKERGLEPLSLLIASQEEVDGDIESIAGTYIDEELEVETVEDALLGAMDIIAESVSDDPEFREFIRGRLFYNSSIITEAVDDKEKSVYEMYYNYDERLKTLPNHRVLAINRGEKEKFIKVKIDSLEGDVTTALKRKIVEPREVSTTKYLKLAIEDSYKRLIFPSIERELRNSLTERAEEDAIKVFGKNLKPLLMQPPINGKVVMGFDPAFRTGCKIAVVDETGKLLDYTTVFPTEPRNEIEATKKELIELINKYEIDMIAIGNGTGSRESEAIVADMISEIDRKVYYTIVNEAGASVYSASKLAHEEYPDINVSIRGALSIGKRLQDPLAELVKIDPKHIGVGQYQHDLNQKKLDETLKGVVEDSVNTVGVDLNTASMSLLSYVAGVSPAVAKNIVEYRDELGKLTSRKDLLKVKRLGPATFLQCAGFLRIAHADYPLDNTSVHPESYKVAEQLLEKLDYSLEDIRCGKLTDIDEKLKSENNLQTIAEELEVGIPTLEDIITEIKKPGRDPRENLDAPILRSDILKIDDLKEGLILTGTVRNVVDFGAFVDIGLDDDGLVHVSQLADRFIKNPMDIVSVGDVVSVKILSIDLDKDRVGLSMKGVIVDMIIKNAKIYTMNDEIIECGGLVIKDGKIEKVIRDENIGKYLDDKKIDLVNIKVIDARGHMLVPGIIDAHCHLGMMEDGMGFEGDDLNEMTDPITPELRAIDALNPQDIRFREAYESGVTTVATGPGSSNIVCGQFAAIKTYGRRIDEMVIKEPLAMKLALGENPKSIFGKNGKSPMTRMAIASQLRELLFKSREYMEDKDSSFDIKLEAMKKVMTGEIPLKVHAHRADDIFTAIRIAKEFNLKLTIDHCTEGHLIADYLKKENLDCIVGPSFTDRSKIELRNLTFETPGVLHEAGVKFALMTDAPEVGLNYLPLCAGLAVKAGLKEIEALKAITINPAEILGIDDRVGSIETGKDADFVVFSSNPLRDVLSEAIITVIDGKVVYENEKYKL